jgi:hypothetical protein
MLPVVEFLSFPARLVKLLEHRSLDALTLTKETGKDTSAPLPFWQPRDNFNIYGRKERNRKERVEPETWKS